MNITTNLKTQFDYVENNLAFLVFQQDDILDQVNNRFKSDLDALIQLGDFKGKKGDIKTFYVRENENHAKRVMFVGMGNIEKVTTESIRRAVGVLGSFCYTNSISNLAIDLSTSNKFDSQNTIEAVLEGLLLGNYRFNTLKTKEKNKNKVIEKITIYCKDTQLDFVKKGQQQAFANIEGTNLTREISNLPSNIATPTYLAEQAKLLEKDGLKVTVFDTEKIKEEKMGLFLGVAKGSLDSDPPKFIIMEHTPENYTKTICLVGKAITFDTGGISIKPSANMGDMKFDMCGGAAVIGAMKAIAKQKPNVRVFGLVPSTPNVPDGKSYRPADILTARNGKTVEVISTDAEGRMLLGDALSYAQDLKPDLVFDFATLTGAVVVGLGQFNAAYYMNEQAEKLKISDLIFQSGRNSGDYVWKMPLEDEYGQSLKSPYADLKHTGERYGGSISAAMFLKEFTNYPWIHFDIAGTAYFSSSSNSKIINYHGQIGATGFGVRLVTEFIRNWK